MTMRTTTASESVAVANFELALDQIPVFPLANVVLFPGATLPLHIFEPRYRALVRDCLAQHRAMVIAHPIAGHDEFGRPRIATVAGGGVIVEHQPLSDGRSNIVVLGKARVSLEEFAPDPLRPYRVARAKLLPELDDLPTPSDLAALATAATMFTRSVKKLDPLFSFALPAGAPAATLADQCAFQLVVDAAARQAILEETSIAKRVRRVVMQLALQQSAMMREGRKTTALMS